MNRGFDKKEQHVVVCGVDDIDAQLLRTMWKVGRGKGLAMDGVADDRYLEDIYKYRSITIQFPIVITSFGRMLVVYRFDCLDWFEHY